MLYLDPGVVREAKGIGFKFIKSLWKCAKRCYKKVERKRLQ